MIRTITIFDSSAGGAGFRYVTRILNPTPDWCCILLVELNWGRQQESLSDVRLILGEHANLGPIKSVNNNMSSKHREEL